MQLQFGLLKLKAIYPVKIYDESIEIIKPYCDDVSD